MAGVGEMENKPGGEGGRWQGNIAAWVRLLIKTRSGPGPAFLGSGPVSATQHAAAPQSRASHLKSAR